MNPPLPPILAGRWGVVRSDDQHERPFRLVDLWNVDRPNRNADLSALEAADSERTLTDWILAQRLPAPFHHKTNRRQLLQDQVAQIAAGPACLRRIGGVA